MKIVALSLLLSVPVPFAWAEDAKKPEPPKAFIDPAKVEDDDFAFQGEYTGENEGKKFGVQIRALGGGKFEALSYQGGLPGDGWDRDRSTITRVNGERAAGEKTAKFEKDDIRATVDGSSILVLNLQGERVLEMNRTSRRSPTLGAKAPAGAVVLFNGKESNHFPGSKVTAEGLLEQGATSADKFGDGTLHVEFMLSYMPAARGQGRSNSGVYLQGRYEVQVLDSFALEGKNNECGGIYTIAAPKQNMCFPPLTWQTYDIDFTAARFDASGAKTKPARCTVKLNGVVTIDDVEIKGPTPGGIAETAEPASLYLQAHGHPSFYRNIWLVEKK